MIGSIKQAEQSNEYDYNKMLKDFKSEERYLNGLKKTRNKWISENKKYLIRLEQMKEKKEENYNTKRNTFLKQYLNKQKTIERQLYKTRVSKQGDWKKNSELMKKMEEEAKEKQKNKLEKDEKDRLIIENKIFTRCKK